MATPCWSAPGAEYMTITGCRINALTRLIDTPILTDILTHFNQIVHQFITTRGSNDANHPLDLLGAELPPTTLQLSLESWYNNFVINSA